MNLNEPQISRLNLLRWAVYLILLAGALGYVFWFLSKQP
jgi:hypothetical protein